MGSSNMSEHKNRFETATAELLQIDKELEAMNV
jgi:hypothetical protein